MILSDFNYYILTNACLYYHVFILARFITKRHMYTRTSNWSTSPSYGICMHVCVCVCVCIYVCVRVCMRVHARVFVYVILNFTH
jgi:hypothetical protein